MTSPLAVAFQLDPLETINYDSDSSLALALEAQRRGHTLYYYNPRDMALEDGRALARVRPLQVRRERGNHHTYGEPETVDLSRFNIILMRQDPPFDMAYITATHILEHVVGRTCVFNNPVEVRNAPEKLFVTHFADLAPPTLISSDPLRIKEFREKHKDIVVKPLYGNGGSGIFHLPREDENLGALLETFTQLYREPIIIQKYLPEIRQGDKRIILIDGKPAGALNRIPAAREVRANLAAGGTATPTTLSAREMEICERIGPELARRNLVFAGIDVIGGYLTEINVTSPTGLMPINRFDNVCLEAQLWDVFEERYAARRT